MVAVDIIDDDPSILNALRSSIQRLGYSAYFYSSRKDFTENGAIESPSVVLIDVKMPEMNGLELQSYCNSLTNPPIVILISGQSHPKEIIDGMIAGAADFLIKPFSLDELDTAIKIAFEKGDAQLEDYHNDKARSHIERYHEVMNT